VNQSAFITHGDQKINQFICNELLDRSYQVCLQFEHQQNADEYTDSMQERWKPQYVPVVNGIDDSQTIRVVLEQSVQKMGGLHLFVHGNEWINEEHAYEKNAEELGNYMTAQFQKLFLWNHHVGIHMAKQREGQLIFPLLNDTLYYLGYPSSPILNHGKISMMKCLARELAPFEVRVNAITFGYYDYLDEREARKKLKKQLEIYALKPPLPKLEQMIGALHLLLQRTEFMISGQNLHIGAGTETSI
jgi:3-oxoacyl-[acyl-carrier protein] reductase